MCCVEGQQDAEDGPLGSNLLLMEALPQQSAKTQKREQTHQFLILAGRTPVWDIIIFGLIQILH